MAERTCSVEGCERRSQSRRGMCGAHYMRWYRHGDVTAVAFIKGDDDARWAQYATAGASGACWEWRGRRARRGYGVFHLDGKDRLAHRVALERSGVVVPDDMFVLHSCDNPPCVNPAHLRVGSFEDNMRDKLDRDRQARGETSPLSKLTAAEVAEIKARLAIATNAAIGAAFGVSAGTIHAIRIGRTWKHVSP